MSDLFISYVSRDKEIAEDLTSAFKQAGISIKHNRIGIGDSLGNSMKSGFENAKFGIIILSPNFFRMPWPRSDLDEIDQIDRQFRGGETTLFPVWHQISQQEIARYSQALAQRIGAPLNSPEDLDFIVEEISIEIKPESASQVQPATKGVSLYGTSTKTSSSGQPDPIILRDQMNQYFSVSELRTLCFDLGIDYEDLPGSTKQLKVIELIGFVQRRGVLDNLIKLLAHQRPNVTKWG